MTEEEKEEATTNNNNIILSNEEREKKVIELYFFKGKRTKDIVQELRMSPKTVGKILDKFRNANTNGNANGNRVGVGVGEKAPVYKVGDNSGNGGNGDARATTTNPPLPQQQILQPGQQQQAILPLLSSTATTIADVKSLCPNEKAAIAYKLYDEGKRPVDVISMLLISAEEANRYFKEFWRLTYQYELYRIYPQIRHEIPYLLKFHKSLRNHGLSDSMEDIDHYVDMLDVVYKKLPEVEAELSDYQTKIEEARNELLSIRQEKRDVLYELRNQNGL